MKPYLTILLTTIITGSAIAQVITEPYIIPEAYSLRISQNGKYVVAQDIAGNGIVVNPQEDEALWYGVNYPGNGNCITNDGVLVGQNMETSTATVMSNLNSVTPPSLAAYGNSSLDAITPDGTRACGYVMNPNVGVLSLPFYCDIAADGTFGEVNILPYPPKDFFGQTPQSCTAVYISDDGKTIAGTVTDDTGFYSYPIVYKQDASGNWSYTCPSEPLFNPDHLPIPQFPSEEGMDLPKQPEITDFMTSEKKAEWEQDMADYEATGDPQLNPWSYVTYFTGEDGYKAFEQAIVDYNRAVNEIYGKAIDNYWKEMAKVAKYACFIPNLALSPQGDVLVADLGITDEEYTTDTYTGYATYKFDLKNGSISIIESEIKNLIPAQITENGTIVTVSSASNELPYTSYMLLPGAEEYISFDEYISQTNPAYLPWLAENLDLLGTGVISGVVNFSGNMEIMVGGLPISNMLSYVMYANNAGIESLESIKDNTYNVYNLSGIKILTTKEESEIKALPKGIYIINGKKIIL